jgi:ABC-type amino acid transport substrate-binding protein
VVHCVVAKGAAVLRVLADRGGDYLRKADVRMKRTHDEWCGKCAEMVRMAGVLVCAALVVAGMGCDTTGRAAVNRVVVVGTDAAFAPFHFVDERGAITGHDVELARRVLERAGYDVRVERVQPYGKLFEGLVSGEIDVVAATTGITPARRARYLFSRAYFETCQAVVVRVGAGEPTSLGDLSGRRVGYAGDGTSARAARGLAGVEMIRLGKGQEGISTLMAGEIDGLVVDEFDAVKAARNSSGVLRVLAEPAAMEEYAFVMRRNRLELKRRVDRALLGLERDGTIERIRAEFGVGRDDDWPVGFE